VALSLGELEIGCKVLERPTRTPLRYTGRHPKEGMYMRGLLTAFCLFCVTLLAADSPFIGTWKLNTAKSKSAPGTATKEMRVIFEPDGSNLKRTATGTDADGNPIKQMATVPWDGKDHRVDAPGGPVITVAVKPLNDHAVQVTVKADGKVVSDGRLVVSRDGKTMTSTYKGEDQKQRKLDNVEVFDKQ